MDGTRGLPCLVLLGGCQRGECGHPQPRPALPLPWLALFLNSRAGFCHRPCLQLLPSSCVPALPLVHPVTRVAAPSAAGRETAPSFVFPMPCTQPANCLVVTVHVLSMGEPSSLAGTDARAHRHAVAGREPHLGTRPPQCGRDLQSQLAVSAPFTLTSAFWPLCPGSLCGLGQCLFSAPPFLICKMRGWDRKFI